VSRSFGIRRLIWFSVANVANPGVLPNHRISANSDLQRTDALLEQPGTVNDDDLNNEAPPRFLPGYFR